MSNSTINLSAGWPRESSVTNDVTSNFKAFKPRLTWKSKASTISIAILMLYFSVDGNAQTSQSSDDVEKRWGAEFSLIGAGVFRLFQAKATYLINPESNFKGEVGLGVLLQPESTAAASESFNEDGLYSAYMASVAYRQYLWRGLHLECVVNSGFARNRNNIVDAQDYDAFLIFTQNFIGYKFEFMKRENFNLFIIGQGGFGYVPLNTNQWPRQEDTSIYGLGDLKIGINF